MFPFSGKKIDDKFILSWAFWRKLVLVLLFFLVFPQLQFRSAKFTPFLLLRIANAVCRLEIALCNYFPTEWARQAHGRERRGGGGWDQIIIIRSICRVHCFRLVQLSGYTIRPCAHAQRSTRATLMCGCGCEMWVCGSKRVHAASESMVFFA